MKAARESNRSVAARSWGGDAPEWVLAIASACDAPGATQGAVGQRIGYTDAVVSQVLRNKYTGRMDKVEAKVRGALMNERVTCPVLAVITTKRCIDEQARRHIGTNENRRALRRECTRCPNRLDKEGS